jgi:hypothetical protein
VLPEWVVAVALYILFSFIQQKTARPIPVSAQYEKVA